MADADDTLTTDKNLANCADCGCEIVKTSHRKILCIPCAKNRKRKQDVAYAATRREQFREKARVWYANNTERAKASNKKRREENVEAERAKDAEEYAKNPEPAKKRAREWYAKNRISVLARMSSEDGRKRSRDRMAAKLNGDPSARLHSNISRSIRSSIKDKKRRGWQEIVGYSLEELTRHLERQFTDGMTWENHGKGSGKWHVDHILPRSMFSFLTSDCPDFKACWAITNLRPLWSEENISKHAKRTLLI